MRGPSSSARITSAANNRVRWLKGLHERRGREAAGAFLVEGPRALMQALAGGASPVLVAYAPDLAERNPRTAEALASLPSGVQLLELDERVLRGVGDTLTSQGVVAAFPLLGGEVPSLDPQHALVLVLDRVRDPGNLGTLLRSAAAAGCAAVLLSEGCADPHAPKVARASAGGIFGVPFAILGWEGIGEAIAALPRRFAAAAGAGTAYYEAELSGGCAILVGNEADGLGEEALSLATEPVSIPIESSIESLNAAVAGSVLLFEARRQRLETGEWMNSHQ